MPALPRRSLSSSLPTILSLSKLLHHIPRNVNLSRSAGLAAQVLAKKPDEPEETPNEPAFWWKLGLSVVLVLAGGVFAGLTLALMGSDDLNLRVLSTSSDDPRERKNATKVLRLLGRGRHWVLVVLLLGNVIVNESLPIFLDAVLGGGVAAVVVSTLMIVIFGEIIPQAVCVRYGLSIGGACAPLVLALMILFAPVAWPTAKLLDYVLGNESGNTYKKAELKSFLQFHREGEEPLRDDEISILNGVLSLNEKKANEIMTPIKDCLTLSADKILDHEAIDQILLSGFSRIPIHEPGQKDNFTGMMLVKRLITYNPDDKWPVSKFPLLPLPEARPDINCFQALDYFQTGRAHLLLISNTPGRKGGALGIVSLEDLIEEIIGEEIIDETDRYQDNRSHKVAKRSGTAAVMRGIIERQRVIGAFSRRPSRGETMQSELSQSLGRNHADGGEALLIQIHDGNLVGEPVNVSDEAKDSEAPKLVVADKSDNDGGKMDTIAEASSVGGKSPLIAPHGENGVKNAGVEAEVGGEITQGEDGGSLKLRSNEDEEDEDDEGDEHKKLIDLREDDDELAVATSLAYQKFEDFERAVKAFVEKYKSGTEQRDEQGETVGAERTNRGWAWREASQKWSKGQGYMYRRVTRYIKMNAKHVRPADVEQVVDSSEDESEGEENSDLEEGEDESSRLIRPPGSQSHRMTLTQADGTSRRNERQSRRAKNQETGSREIGASQRDNVEQRDSDSEEEVDGGDEGEVKKISVEHHIVHSKTYHCPQLLLRAWNEDGAPLGLSDLLKYRIIHSGAHLPDSTMPARTDVLLLDPHSPFPLLQQLEHPFTGDVVWSVHPCQVGTAVEEVLSAEEDEKARRTARGGVEGEKGKDIKTGRELRWLETWVMLSSGVVDLSG